jgi:hypothetical protein
MSASLCAETQPRDGGEAPPIDAASCSGVLKEARSAAAVGLLVAAFCGVLLLHDPHWFWQDDYQSYQLANYRDLARAWAEGEVPLLSPYSWHGGALAGEYQNGVFSLFLTGLIVVVFGAGLSLPLAAAFLSIVHLAVLAAGTFCLARRRGLTTDLATFAALVVTLSGWTMIWGARAWFPALASFAWLPWFWWALERARDEGRGVGRYAVPAVFLYLLITAGWPFTVLMAGLLSAGLAVRNRSEDGSWRSSWPIVAAWVAGLSLSAPAWLMLLEYTGETVRAHTPPLTLNWEWRVSPMALFGLALPAVPTPWVVFNLHRWHTNLELAGGLAPLAALLAAVGLPGRQVLRRFGWEIALALLTLTLAMLPSLGTFRWSFRWLPLFFLALSLIGAGALARLRAATEGPSRPNPGVWAALLVVLAALLGLSLYPSTDVLILGAIQTALCVLWALAESKLDPASILRRWSPCLLVLASAWLYYHAAAAYVQVPGWDEDVAASSGPLDPNRRYLHFHTAREFAGRPNRPVEPGTPPRPTPILPGNGSLYAGMEFVTGYSPMQPHGLAHVLGLGVKGDTLVDDPGPTAGVDGWHIPQRSLALTRPGGLCDLMAVDGIILAKRFAEDAAALEPNGWEPHATFRGATVYHRQGSPSERVRTVTQADRTGDRELALTLVHWWSDPAEPHVLYWPEAPAEVVPERFATARVSLHHESRNTATAEVTASPGTEEETLVVFARPWYPGYRATFNGQPVPVGRLDLILPAVRLPAGESGTLVLEYAPRSFTNGCLLAAVTGAGLLALALCGFSRRRAATDTDL